MSKKTRRPPRPRTAEAWQARMTPERRAFLEGQGVTVLDYPGQQQIFPSDEALLYMLERLEAYAIKRERERLEAEAEREEKQDDPPPETDT